MNAITTVGVREFRDNLGRYLALVKGGNAIAITSHGKTVAELRTPFAEPTPIFRRVGGLKHLGPLPADWDEWDDDFYAALEAPIDPEPS